ncbi:MAG: hypothetical protein D6701_11215 [Gemmatimonadetes bacterium]|nr:MAG: hypothetical protein D6701_11215 [Gemmatimonadota bacterium]
MNHPADTSRSPLAEIWFAPRTTVRWVVRHDPNYLVIPLAVVAGVAGGVWNAVGLGLGPGGTFLLASAAGLMGGAWGVASLYLTGWALRVTGRWLGGQATPEEMRAAIAWGGVPAATALVLFVPALAADTLLSGGAQLAALASIGVAQMVLGVWSLVTLTAAIAEVQRFSAMRAFVNLALPGVLFGGIFLAIALVLGLLFILV